MKVVTAPIQPWFSLKKLVIGCYMVFNPFRAELEISANGFKTNLAFGSAPDTSSMRNHFYVPVRNNVCRVGVAEDCAEQGHFVCSQIR